MTGLNARGTLVVPVLRLDGERVPVRETRVDARTVDLAIYVSELEGSHTVSVDARETVREVVGRDTLWATREATGEGRPTIARTYWRRLVTGTSAYESNVSDVFADARGDLWVRLSAYRSSFWSSPDGQSFSRRRSGFERFIASEGDTAWIEYNTAGSGGQVFLAQVDLATGQTVDEYQVIYNHSLATGASGGGRFHGVYQDRRYLMEIRGGIVTFVEGGAYDDDAIGALDVKRLVPMAQRLSEGLCALTFRIEITQRRVGIKAPLVDAQQALQRRNRAARLVQPFAVDLRQPPE